MSSVRTQLILWNVAILTLILVFCGSAVRFRMEAGLIDTVQRELLDRAKPAIDDGPPRGPQPGRPPARQPRRQGAGAPVRSSAYEVADSGQPTGQPYGQPGGGFPGMQGGPGQGAPMQGGPMGGGPMGGGPMGGGPMGGYPGGPPPGQAGMNGLPPQPDGNYPPSGQGADYPQSPPAPAEQHRGRPDVRVIKADGTDLNGNAPFSAEAYQESLHGNRKFSTVVQDGVRFLVYSVPVDRNGINAVIQTEESLAPVDAELADLNKALLTLLPIGLIIAALGAGFLTIRSLRPVRQLAAAVQNIQAEDLKRRLPVNGQDEFARLSGTINGMLGRLSSAFDEQRRFTMDASHELKTPLTVIKAKTSVALTRERTPESYQATLETVERAADQMTKIVQNLLLLAQADSGQLGRDKAPVSVKYVVDSALDGVFADGAGPKLTVEIPEPAPMIIGNSSQ